MLPVKNKLPTVKLSWGTYRLREDQREYLCKLLTGSIPKENKQLHFQIVEQLSKPTFHVQQIKTLQKKIDEGLKSFDRGKSISGDVAFAKLKHHNSKKCKQVTR